MKPRLITATGAVIAAIALTAATVRATVLVGATVDELAADARFVVHGTVSSVEPHWVEGRRQIERVVTVDVAAALKGEASEVVSFVVPGGEIWPYRTVTIGAPELREGDELVVFLGGRRGERLRPLGLSQGVFRVVADARSGAKVVRPAALVSPGTDEPPQAVVRGDRSRRPPRLDAFLDQVTRLVARAAESDVEGKR